MPDLTLKNVPLALHRTLKKQAKAHHRSLNKEVIATLQASMGESPGNNIAQQLAEARELRSRCKRTVTLEEIQAWKIEVRR